jgi:hypothetical protein
MLDLAKAIHEAFGIDYPRLFMVLFAFFGCLLGGGLGWVVDRSYRVKLREQVTQSAPTSNTEKAGRSSTVSGPPVPTNQSVRSAIVHPTPHPRKAHYPSAEQHSTGPNSPNVMVNGNNNKVDTNHH